MAETFSGRPAAGAPGLRAALEIASTATDVDDPEWHAWTALCNLWLRESGSGRDLMEQAAETARSRSALGVLVVLLMYLAIDQATRRPVGRSRGPKF